MTSKELAAMLNGRQYGEETTPEIVQLAKDNGLVIVYANTNESAIFKGAFWEEFEMFLGGEICFNNDGSNFTYRDGEAFLDRYKSKHKPEANTIEVVWYDDEEVMHEGTGLYYSWTYKTEIPHETFDIFDEGDPYCRGIVFSVNDLK